MRFVSCTWHDICLPRLHVYPFSTCVQPNVSFEVGALAPGQIMLMRELFPAPDWPMITTFFDVSLWKGINIIKTIDWWKVILILSKGSKILQRAEIPLSRWPACLYYINWVQYVGTSRYITRVRGRSIRRNSNQHRTQKSIISLVSAPTPVGSIRCVRSGITVTVLVTAA